jgi:hypothetical protein
MKQSLLGLGIALVGLLVARYSKALAKTSKAINERIGGLTF